MKQYVVGYNISSDVEDFDDYIAVCSNSYEEAIDLALA